MERRPFEVPEYSIMLLTIRLPNGVAPKIQEHISYDTS